MTRPIFEPSLSRKDAELNYGVQQLFRRPAQSPVTPSAEWVFFQSTTNWGTSATILDFTEAGGSYNTTGTATFDLDSGNPVINIGGVYDIHAYVINLDISDGTQWVDFDLEFQKVAGPNGGGPQGWTQGSSYLWRKNVFIANMPVGYGNCDPTLHTFVGLDPGDFVGTPFQFQLDAVKYWDGVATADSNVVVRLLVTRVGDFFV